MLQTAFLFVLSLAAAADRVVSGTVLDADGKPAAGAKVLLSDGPLVNRRLAAFSAGRVPLQPKVVARAICDATGTFAIGLEDDVPETDWARTWLVLWVHRPGSALSTYVIGRDWPARAAPLELRLTAAPPLSLVVSGPDGKPFPLARVLPRQVDDLHLPHELAEQLASTADDVGRAVLRDVAAESVDSVRVETDEYGVQWASLTAADEGPARRVVLGPVAALRGRLTADDPRAISGVKIRLATWQAAGDDLAGGGLAEATTDAEGSFKVPAIAAGTLSASLELHDELPFLCQPITARPVAGETELTINLERAVRAEGVVRDRDSGEPLGGAAVWLRWLFVSPDDDPRTDEGGRYTGLLLPGRVSPSFRRTPRHYYFPQYVLDTQPVPAGAAMVELKPLLLARGVTVLGRVVDGGGHGVAGAEIEAQWELPSGGEYSAHARSNRDGAFTLDGIEPNAQLKLSATSDRGATHEALTIPAGAERQ
ncbi:MAG TPA: carboxypeptidase-like regulatory domain-containing protein, partial [Pirellulales bacterium]|nr:carboxypeptidase-like regulatory domain-containing protein [Pirellulales bacterium]